MEDQILLIIVAFVAVIALVVLIWQITGFARKLDGRTKPSKKSKDQAESGFIL
jgi:predicted permease